MSPAQAE
jgi:hypothetical protein